MSAAVAARQQQQSGNTAHNGGSNSNSRMGTGSPVDSKRSNVKNEDKSSRPLSTASSYNQRDSSKISSPKSTSHPQSSLPASNTSSSIHPPQVAVNQPPETSSSAPSASNPSGSPQNQHAKQAPRSLPPPPPPGQSQRDTPSDYFTINHHSRLDQEPNVFEQSFASNSGTTPNDPLATPKAILPPVTAITSPASLLPGGHLNWGINSLRSGPLSPAMLQGPASNSNGVSSGPLGFDSHIRTGLTPNESGIRSGLTPGGTGSIFAQSQNAIFQFAGGGGTTPGTLEFHKTAISAVRKGLPGMSTSQHIPVKPEENTSGDHDQKSRQHSDPYSSDPAHNAASGLYLLAQAQHQQGDGAAGSMAGSSTGYQGGNQLSSGMSGSNGGSTESSSPNLIKRAVVNSANNAAMSSSINRSSSGGGSMTNNSREISELSDDFSDSGGEGEMPTNSNSGSRNTRARKGKGAGSTTGRRKAEDQSPGGGRSQNKKAKGNQGQSISGGSDDGNDGMDMDDNQTGKDGKKMTDEEKRKNFLERNRVAALKCRQRKKQWLANLQAKVELYSSENDALTAQVTALREEIMSLKTLLLAHKDCPVALANGLNINLEAVTSGMGGVGVPGSDFSHVPMMATNYRLQMGNNGGNNGMGSNGMGNGMMGPPGSGRRYS